METPETEYIRRLRNHDWFHEYSEDYQVWQRGVQELARLRELRKQIDPDCKLWNHYCPKEMKCN